MLGTPIVKGLVTLIIAVRRLHHFGYKDDPVLRDITDKTLDAVETYINSKAKGRLSKDIRKDYIRGLRAMVRGLMVYRVPKDLWFNRQTIYKIPLLVFQKCFVKSNPQFSSLIQPLWQENVIKIYTGLANRVKEWRHKGLKGEEPTLDLNNALANTTRLPRLYVSFLGLAKLYSE